MTLFHELLDLLHVGGTGVWVSMAIIVICLVQQANSSVHLIVAHAIHIVDDRAEEVV